MDNKLSDSQKSFLAPNSARTSPCNTANCDITIRRCQLACILGVSLAALILTGGALCNGCLIDSQQQGEGPHWSPQQARKVYAARDADVSESSADVSPFSDLLDWGSGSSRADISRGETGDEANASSDAWRGEEPTGGIRRGSEGGLGRGSEVVGNYGGRVYDRWGLQMLEVHGLESAVVRTVGAISGRWRALTGQSDASKLPAAVSAGHGRRSEVSPSPQHGRNPKTLKTLRSRIRSDESAPRSWGRSWRVGEGQKRRNEGGLGKAAEQAQVGTGEGGTWRRREGRRQQRRRLLEEENIPKHRSLHKSRKLEDKCWSRSERYLYHRGSSIMASQAWSRKLTQYAVMHRRCTTKINDWVAFYRNPFAGDGIEEGADVSGCKYLVWISPGYAGLGNRLASLTSTFLYAVLTDRALLISNHSNLGRLLCNPFPESTWLIDEPSYLWIKRNAYQWFPRVQLYRTLLENGTQEYRKAVFINLKYNCEEEDWSFFCGREQKSLLAAPFAFLLTDEYMVPGLHLVPRFQKEIERLFPDGLVFTHAARYLLHPNNYLWERITRIYHGYLAHNDVKVGIQVRTFHEHDRNTDPRVLDCAMNVSKYLPQFESQEAWMERLDERKNDPRAAALVTNPNPKTIGVFITSLQLHHYEYIKKAYTDGQTEDGSIVTLHFESSEGVEQRNKHDQYERALVEIWLLSFTEKLIISEFSSFGYIAAGLAAIVPYEMNIADGKEGSSYKNSTRPVCALGAIEPCYIVPPHYLPCDGRQDEPNRIHESVRTCPNIEKGISLQMSPSWKSHWR